MKRGKGENDEAGVKKKRRGATLARKKEKYDPAHLERKGRSACGRAARGRRDKGVTQKIRQRGGSMGGGTESNAIRPMG